MATTTREAFWAFIFYIKHSPHVSIESMTEQDLDEMIVQFAAVNATETSIATDPLDYGDADYPAKGSTTRWAADQGGIATGTDLPTNIAACEQALYPEGHLSGG
jgi:hypothetical protein